jgi:peptidoglycan/xylan/chitin deacetylase (PgdA/CDA1 family)
VTRPLTIVAYHYVRDVWATPFPRIRGLSVGAFEQQLDYFESHFSIIGPVDVLAAVATGEHLPPNAILLTFDDGYSDHFTNVLPILAERGHTAMFFPAVRPLAEGSVLDVNKVQFILAAASNVNEITRKLQEIVARYGDSYNLMPIETYWSKFSQSSRFDDPMTAFIKRMLQKGLPERLRSEFVNELFQYYVTGDERSFAADLYASAEQLREMRAMGMHIGCHGYGHYWLDTLSPAEQLRDIERALGWLKKAAIIGNRWTMCYPHGRFNETLIRTLRLLDCSLAFTVEPLQADLDHDLMRLSRFDTNDLKATTTRAAVYGPGSSTKC